MTRPCGCKGTPDDCCSACAHRWLPPATDGEGFLLVAESARPVRRRERPLQLALLPEADGYGTALLG